LPSFNAGFETVRSGVEAAHSHDSETVVTAAMPIDGPVRDERAVHAVARLPVALSEPLPASGANRDARTTGELKRRLSNAGLHAPHMVAVARLSRTYLDSVMPIAIHPKPVRIVRTTLLVVYNVDPQLNDKLEALIVQLGSADYVTRERAEAALSQAGRSAVPALKRALENDDPEVVYRVERLLSDLRGATPPRRK
jgi:hypothetical protein